MTRVSQQRVIPRRLLQSVFKYPDIEEAFSAIRAKGYGWGMSWSQRKLIAEA